MELSNAVRVSVGLETVPESLGDEFSMKWRIAGSGDCTQQNWNVVDKKRRGRLGAPVNGPLISVDFAQPATSYPAFLIFALMVAVSTGLTSS
jgi:hypothetical protein